jgi:hypothetical protein
MKVGMVAALARAQKTKGSVPARRTERDADRAAIRQVMLARHSFARLAR